jgi:hypothetical protein
MIVLLYISMRVSRNNVRGHGDVTLECQGTLCDDIVMLHESVMGHGMFI